MEKLRAMLAAHKAARFNVGTFKDWTGISRKYAIPLLEYNQAAGRKSHRSGGERPHRNRPGQLEQDLLRMDVQHPRLVHLAPALVGPSRARLALPGVSRNCSGARGAGNVYAVRLQPTGAGSRRPRHVVQLRPLALL